MNGGPADVHIWHGDCLRRLAEIPDGVAALVFADLPYVLTAAKWDQFIPFEALWPHWRRILRPNGVVLVCAAELFSAVAKLSNPRWYKYTWYWEKSKPTNYLNVSHQPLRKVEEVVVFYRKKPTYHPQLQVGDPYDKGVRKAADTGVYRHFAPVRVKSDTGVRQPTNKLYFKTAETEGPVWHSTQKPVALIEYMLRTYTDPGDLVVDPACGSGTTLVACQRLGRRGIGIELDAEQVEIGRLRVELDALLRQTGTHLNRQQQERVVARALEQGVIVLDADGREESGVAR